MPARWCRLVCLIAGVGWWLPAVGDAAEPSVVPPELARWLAPQAWQRDVEAPVVSLGSPGDFDDTHIFAPAVACENGRFRMWYCGSQGTRYTRVFRLGLATSADGTRFEKDARNPVLAMIDGERSVLTPSLVRTGDGNAAREEGKLRMYFSATDFDKTTLHTLHESTSSDGVHWSEPSPPLVEHVYAPSVLKTRAGYRMWYTDVSRRPWLVRHARSADGNRWTVDERAALEFTQPWESGILVYPCVLEVDGVYLMWYGSYQKDVKQTTAIGFAASVDGHTWHKHPQNPVLQPDPARAWESHYVTSGSVLRLADGSFRYWYASRTKPPFVNLYYAINTARWAGPKK